MKASELTKTIQTKYNRDSSNLFKQIPRLIMLGYVLETSKKPLEYRITREGIRFLKLIKSLETPLETVDEILEGYLISKGYSELTPAQNQFLTFFNKYKDKNTLIISNPGTGKTFMALQYIVQIIRTNPSSQIIYLTPYKAINREKYIDFTKYLSELKTQICDGDNPEIPAGDIKIIFSTYERCYGGILRKELWVQNASLIIADELDILISKTRGFKADIVLSRLKQSSKQIVALSSFIGGLEQLLTWLDAKLFFFDNPRAMEEILIHKDPKLDIYIWEDIHNRRSYDKISHSYGEAIFNILEEIKLRRIDRKSEEITQILVETRSRARRLALEITNEFTSDEKPVPSHLFSSIETTPLITDLIECLNAGIAFHHAGLPSKARKVVEDLLRKKEIWLIVSTSTLSRGVHFEIDQLVIEKPEIDQRSNIFNIDRVNYLQAIGRLRRPSSTFKPVVYILTNDATQFRNSTIYRPFEKDFEKIENSERIIEQIELELCQIVKINVKGITQSGIIKEVNQEYQECLNNHLYHPNEIKSILKNLVDNNLLIRKKNRYFCHEKTNSALFLPFPLKISVKITDWAFNQFNRNKIEPQNLSKVLLDYCILFIPDLAKSWESDLKIFNNPIMLEKFLKEWISEEPLPSIMYEFEEFYPLSMFHDFNIDIVVDLALSLLWGLEITIRKKIEENQLLLDEIKKFRWQVKYGFKADLYPTTLVLLSLTRNEIRNVHQKLFLTQERQVMGVGHYYERYKKVIQIRKNLIHVLGKKRAHLLYEETKLLKDFPNIKKEVIKSYQKRPH